MCLIRIIAILLLSSILVQCLEFHVSIILMDGKVDTAIYTEEKFPDIGKLFGVQGTDVKRLNIIGTNINEINPGELAKLANLTVLLIKSNDKIKTLPPYTFQKNAKLIHLSLTDNSIETLSMYAFDGIFNKAFITGRLVLSNNKLTTFPIFSTRAPGLEHLNLTGNPIQEINEKSFHNLPRLGHLLMANTGLTRIPDRTFMNASNLAEFDVSGSANLKDIDKKAFIGAKLLRTLRLDRTKITKLPSEGLKQLETLSFQGVDSLWSIPNDVVNLPRLRYVKAPEQRRFLCCAFLYKRAKNILVPQDAPANMTRICGQVGTKPTLATTETTRTYSTPTIFMPSTNKMNISTLKLTTTVDPWAPWGRFKRALLWFDDNWVPTNPSSSKPTKFPQHFTDNWGTNTVSHGSVVYHCTNRSNLSFIKESLPSVECSPGPDALRPCDDIMGNVGLTTLTWLVSFLAVAGNGIVFIILVLSRRHFAVTKFLIINLVFADMCLGLYLFILSCASIDSSGEYYNSIVSWQYNGGCDVVGFLAIFSSELSMLVLTIITIERYLAIVYAVYLQKRLKMHQAWILVGASWFISILLALLPLVGVNNYNEVAICLPFSISSTGDKAYLAFVLGFNSLLFIIVLGCYIKIYYEVAGPQASGRPPSQTNDKSIAKRIALLVFTDFACWLPIAIVGIIAAAGYSQSINMTVEKSKYLLVIFFPINSVCNPFLYALSTKTFRREFYTVLAQCGFCRERLHKFQSNTYTGHSSRKIDKKVRRNTETCTLDIQSTATQLELHSVASKGKAGLQGEIPVNNRPVTPSADPLIISNINSPCHSNNNSSFIVPPLAGEEQDAAAVETSFTANGITGCTNNNYPQGISRDLSVISETDPTAPLTDSSGVIENGMTGVHSQPFNNDDHIIETAIRF